MDTNYFKIIIQVLAIAIAIGGSVETKACEKKAVISITGYISVNPTDPCNVRLTCGILGPACTAIN